MSRKTITLIIILYCSCIVYAQKINGTWASSAGGKVIIVENGNGFQYKSLNDGSVWNTYFIGYNYGFPIYRMDLQDGSYILYMVNEAKITLSHSLNPINVIVWTKESNYIDNGNSNSNSEIRYNEQYKREQNATINLVPGASYIAKKMFLEDKKRMKETELKNANYEYQHSNSDYNTSITWKIDRLTKEINELDMQLLDLEQMKQRGEIK